VTNYYRTKRREFGKTWAILDEKNQVVLCDYRRHRSWQRKDGEKRSLIKFNRIGLQEIETIFSGSSDALDGPHLFWRVRLSIRRTTQRGCSPSADAQAKVFWTEVVEGIQGTRTSVFKPGLYKFITLEEALAFHEKVRNQCSEEIRSSRIKPEKSQELLAELSHWCEQRWGRQAEVASAVGTSRQTVNDWLSGRKKMTGEQALRVQEFLLKTRRRSARK
jgi:predicted XRE-type DNA-binding protein